MQTDTLCRLSIALGVVSCAAMLAALMALQDIFHEEADLALEWNVLRVSFGALIAFHIFGLVSLVRLNLERAERRSVDHVEPHST